MEAGMNLVIATNGPGEVSTWVKPFIDCIRRLDLNLKIWVFITPCMFASGREKKVLQGFEGIEGIFSSSELYALIIFGKKPKGFSYTEKGAVLCLGGDPAFARTLSKRLKYRGYAYCERAAGITYRSFDYFVPSESILNRLVRKGAAVEKVLVAGTPAADLQYAGKDRDAIRKCLGVGTDKMLVNILPGSRYSLIELSIPFFFQAVEGLPGDFFVMFTIAPFVGLDEVETVLDKHFNGTWKYIHKNGDISHARIRERTVIFFHGSQYAAMAASDLAVILPGSSNMELAAMQVPALVVLPLNYPDRIPLPGIAGYLGRLPVIGNILKRNVLFPSILNRLDFISPLNRQAGCEILPEMTGILKPEDIESKIIDICRSDLAKIRERLCKAANPAGASRRMVQKILEDLKGGV